jgi:predicted acylesterase/phospholipase RssA
MFETIVLSGGGVKGLGELGALHYYVENGIVDLTQVKEYATASIGSVIAGLLIIGFTPMEIFLNIYLLENLLRPSNENIVDIIKNFGLTSIKSVIEPIRELFLKKCKQIPTLAEVKSKYGKNIIISVVNETLMRVEYFTPETQPELNLLDAIMMSCNLPLIFKRIPYQGYHYVDGGLVDPCPLYYVDDGIKKILCIVVKGSSFKISLGKETNDGFTSYFYKFLSYFYHLFIIPLNAVTGLRCNKYGPNVTLVDINYHNVSPVNFDLTKDEKMAIFTRGYQEVELLENVIRLKVPGWNPYPVIEEEYNKAVVAWDIDDLYLDVDPPSKN